MDRLTPGLLALVVGGFLAIALFVPFVVVEYRRRGGIGPARLMGWIALLVYGVGVLAYTLLPLPSPAELVCAPANLHAFQFVDDIRGDLADGSTLVGSTALQQFALNVLLFVPLGFFLRALFGRGLVFTLFTGLAASMFIEATQATGVWWLYECAYRVFDVDDLLANGLGTLAGSLLAWMLLPHRRTAAPDPAAPRPVTAPRRLLGMVCDWLAVVLLGGALDLGIMLAVRLVEPDAMSAFSWVGEAIVLVVVGCWVVLRGSTPGETAVLLAGVGGRRPRWASRLLRYLAGIGGYQLLSLAELDWAAFGLFVVSVVAVFATPDRRGFAAAVAGMGVADVRAVRADRDPSPAVASA